MELKKALLIGVSKYASFPNLKFCKNDVREMAKVLRGKSLGYDVNDDLVGEVKWQEMRDATRDFFLGETVNSKDTLLFYFTGHGVLDRTGRNHYFASSEINSQDPGGKGFWFNELDQILEDSISRRKVIVLDCCYAGAMGTGLRKRFKKGGQEEAKKGAVAIRNKIRSGTGTCILSACFDTQEAESTAKGDLSVFTHFLLEGLKGIDNEYVDPRGNITPHLIGRYVYDKITSLPKSEQPKQIPIIKTEMSGEIILATYPDKIKQDQRGMSGKLLLELLEQEKIAEFNEMRERDPLIVPNLHRVNLEGANLQNANLEGANLYLANLIGANLYSANLQSADLKSANFKEAHLHGARLEGTNLEGANLQNANLEGANLYSANLERAYLIGAKLKQAYLFGVHLEGANLRAADLEGANLEQANLIGANLVRAALKGANLFKAQLLSANLSFANLEGAFLGFANLGRATLGGANLERAKLERSNLEQANLFKALLTGANLEGANLNGAQLRETNLRNTLNLPISKEEAKSRGAIV